MMPFAAILPAAGSARRFGSNKLLAPLQGKSVLWHSIQPFARRHITNGGDCAAIILAGPADAVADQELKAHLCSLELQVPIQICPGGDTRAHSVWNAVKAVGESIEWVAIHDAARPLVSARLIDEVFAAARKYGSAGPALAVHLTIKEAAGPLPAKVEKTIPRASLWAMQTPQFARRSDLLAAFAACPIPLEQVTDDLQLLELAGKSSWLIEGETGNIKITTPHDLQWAEGILRQR